ncbi:MAG: hypothetical protein KDN20_20005 [Verrucomicrobiae bacterium]|nr:hypothetical protein [Verrucomicrobiae bacterium]
MKSIENRAFMTLHCHYKVSTILAMSKQRLSRFSIFALTLISTATLAVCQEDGDFGAPRLEEPDWLENYYLDPTPEQFVEKMREYSQDGTLVNEEARGALVGFISQLIRQNRDKIDDWYTALSGLTPEEKQVLHTAMLFSHTEESKAILKLEFDEKFETEKEELPKILELKLDEVRTLDMLWGFFYATGSENAIRRIIACFQFADTKVDPNSAKIPEGYSPLSEQLPEAAAWSLKSNAIRHEKVKDICFKLYGEKKTLSPTEKSLLREKVLSGFLPEDTPEGQ